MSEISGRVVLFAHSRRANLGSGRDHRAKGKEVTDQEDPFSGLALDRAIHFRWVLRDIVGNGQNCRPLVLTIFGP